MDQQKRKPLTEDIRDDKREQNTDTGIKKDAQPVPVYAERAETVIPEADPEELKALALAYARYLAEYNMAPGDPTFTDSEPEEAVSGHDQEQRADSISAEADAPAEQDNSAEESDAGQNERPSGKKKKNSKKKKAAVSADKDSRKMFDAADPSEQELLETEKKLEKAQKTYAGFASVFDWHDRLQQRIDVSLRDAGIDLVAAGHRITSTYRQSRKYC